MTTWSDQQPTSATWGSQTPTAASWGLEEAHGQDVIVAGATISNGQPIGLLLALTYAEQVLVSPSTTSVWSLQNATAGGFSIDTPDSATWNEEIPN